MVNFSGILIICAACGLAASANSDAIYRLAAANNQLALKLLRQVKLEEGNVFLSPFSVSSAFGMLYYGTRGQTAKELRKVLGYETVGLSDDAVHRTYSQYMKQVLPKTGQGAYVFNSANAVLLDKHESVVPDYKKSIQSLYNASVRAVDFRTQHRQVVQSVNSWVGRKTRGMIKSMLSQLSPNTKLFLLNAVYFKGTWQTKFNPSDTTPQSFYVNGLKSTPKEVPMMTTTANFPYFNGSGFQAVGIPYVGKNLFMLVLLPHDRNGVKPLERTLTPRKLSFIKKQLKLQKIHLTVPKFKLELQRDLRNDFKKLGAKAIFQAGANFSAAVRGKNTFVNQILHKAVIEVNEKGSEAAATTGMGYSRSLMKDPVPVFFADHPFVFAVVDRRNNMILFLGRLTDV